MPLESWEHTFQAFFIDCPHNCTCSSGGWQFLVFTNDLCGVWNYNVTILDPAQTKTFSLMRDIEQSRANSFGTRKTVTRHPIYKANVWCSQVTWLAVYTSSIRVVLCSSEPLVLVICSSFILYYGQKKIICFFILHACEVSSGGYQWCLSWIFLCPLRAGVYNSVFNVLIEERKCQIKLNFSSTVLT